MGPSKTEDEAGAPPCVQTPEESKPDVSAAGERDEQPQEIRIQTEKPAPEKLTGYKNSAPPTTDEKDTRLPVTVLSGFLGSGKTTTLTHLLTNTEGWRIALIVNDMAAVNVDALEVDAHITKQYDEQLQQSKNSPAQKKAKQSTSPTALSTASTAADLSTVSTAEASAAVQKAKVAPKTVALQNGCICCTLREDLVEQVAELTADGKYDYLIIESTGISEPIPVAQTFCHSLQELEQLAGGGGGAAHDHSHDGHSHDHSHSNSGEDGADKDKSGTKDKQLAVQAIELQKIARLDTMVTVVDAAEIWDVLGCLETIGESKWSKPETKGEGSTEGIDLNRNIADLLVDQIEFANVILLNKQDLLLEKTKILKAKNALPAPNSGHGLASYQSSPLEIVENLVKRLNPKAKVYWTEHGKTDPAHLLGTYLFDFTAAQSAAGWIQELSGGVHVPETEEYGISSVVFRANRPFHPKKLRDILNGFGHVSDHVPRPNVKVGLRTKQEKKTAYEKEQKTFHGVIRSKGTVWIANCIPYRLDWHSVGRQFTLLPGPLFSAAMEEAGFSKPGAAEGAERDEEEGPGAEAEGKKEAAGAATPGGTI
eukprot:g15327.t1